MSPSLPLCPRLAMAFQVAASVVVGLVLGLVPFKGSKPPFDLVFANLVLAGEQTGGLIPLAMLNGDDPVVLAKALFALEALVLRDLARGVAVWLVVGGPAVPATEIPDELVPEGEVVEILARLVEQEGKDADDSYVLGAAALNRWNVTLAILSEPRIWQLTRKLVEVLLADDLAAEKLDEIIEADEALAGLLDDYQAAVTDVILGWHRKTVMVGIEVAS